MSFFNRENQLLAVKNAIKSHAVIKDAEWRWTSKDVPQFWLDAVCAFSNPIGCALVIQSWCDNILKVFNQSLDENSEAKRHIEILAANLSLVGLNGVKTSLERLTRLDDENDVWLATLKSWNGLIATLNSPEASIYNFKELQGAKKDTIWNLNLGHGTVLRSVLYNEKISEKESWLSYALPRKNQGFDQIKECAEFINSVQHVLAARVCAWHAITPEKLYDNFTGKNFKDPQFNVLKPREFYLLASYLAQKEDKIKPVSELKQEWRDFSGLDSSRKFAATHSYFIDHAMKNQSSKDSFFIPYFLRDELAYKAAELPQLWELISDRTSTIVGLNKSAKKRKSVELEKRLINEMSHSFEYWSSQLNGGSLGYNEQEKWIVFWKDILNVAQKENPLFGFKKLGEIIGLMDHLTATNSKSCIISVNGLLRFAEYCVKNQPDNNEGIFPENFDFSGVKWSKQIDMKAVEFDWKYASISKKKIFEDLATKIFRNEKNSKVSMMDKIQSRSQDGSFDFGVMMTDKMLRSVKTTDPSNKPVVRKTKPRI